MVRILGFVLVVLLAVAGAAFAAVCPANHVGNNNPIIAAVHRDSLCSSNPCYWKSNWDNSLGIAHCEAGGAFCFSEGVATSDVSQLTTDDFVLTGPAGPNPVTIQVFLHATGSASNGCHTFCDPFSGCTTTCSPGSISATITDGAQSSTTGQVASLSNAIRSLTLSETVGQHFHLDRTLFAHSFCGSFSTISSSLDFVLPPGYGLTSCYGYTISSPVPALQTSWGRVKTLYR